MWKRLLESRNNFISSSVNGLRQVKSRVKRLKNYVCKFEINLGILKAAKNVIQVYEKIIEDEKLIRREKRKASIISNSNTLRGLH